MDQKFGDGIRDRIWYTVPEIRTFFEERDYEHCRDLLGQSCRAAGVAVRAWCVMPVHVHLILVPGDRDGLRRALANVHGTHAGMVHARQRRTGHFWQGRFGAVAMDEAHPVAAWRCAVLNRVRARLVTDARDWPWSTVHAHLCGADDGATTPGSFGERFADPPDLLAGTPDTEAVARLRQAQSIGRSEGDAALLERIEARLGRAITPRKSGPKPKGKSRTEE